MVYPRLGFGSLKGRMWALKEKRAEYPDGALGGKACTAAYAADAVLDPLCGVDHVGILPPKSIDY